MVWIRVGFDSFPNSQEENRVGEANTEHTPPDAGRAGRFNEWEKDLPRGT